VCYGVFEVEDPHAAGGRLNLSKFKYRVLIDIRPIRDDIQLILCVGMHKDAPALLEAKFAQRTPDLATIDARYDGKIYIHGCIHVGNVRRDRAAANNDNFYATGLEMRGNCGSS